MDRKQAIVAALVVAGMTGTVYAQPVNTTEDGESRTLVEQKDTEYFRCETGSIPETSILRQAEQDLREFLNLEPDGEVGYCRSWTGTFLVQENDGISQYRIGVLAYQNRTDEALLAVERNDEGVAYAEVRAGNETRGATDADGMLKVNLTDVSSVAVETSGDDLYLEVE